MLPWAILVMDRVSETTLLGAPNLPVPVAWLKAAASGARGGRNLLPGRVSVTNQNASYDCCWRRSPRTTRPSPESDWHVTTALHVLDTSSFLVPRLARARTRPAKVASRPIRTRDGLASQVHGKVRRGGPALAVCCQRLPKEPGQPGQPGGCMAARLLCTSWAVPAG